MAVVNRRRRVSRAGGLLAVVTIGLVVLGVYVQVRTAPGPVVVPDPAYEAQTEIRLSLIPGAGNGLFARVPITAGEVVGELGGRLVVDSDPVHGFAYLAALEACALPVAEPYRYLDARQHGGHVSRINFAPHRINGTVTGLQNTELEQLCEHPWVIFTATRDIEAGEELLASYGDEYDYDFMWRPEVQAYFCERAAIDCSGGFSFDP
jgi:hypothetical protein